MDYRPIVEILLSKMDTDLEEFNDMHMEDLTSCEIELKKPVCLFVADDDHEFHAIGGNTIGEVEVKAAEHAQEYGCDPIGLFTDNTLVTLLLHHGRIIHKELKFSLTIRADLPTPRSY